MTDKYTIAEKEQIFMDVVNRMKDFTAPSITQICGSIDRESGKLAGTGTFFRLRGADYLLTAQHVAGEMYRENVDGSRMYAEGLCHSVGNDQKMMNVLFPWITWNPPQDLAVTRLSPVVLEGSDRIPLTAGNIALNSASLSDRDVYFVHGFPGKQSHFTTFFGRGVISRSLPYGGWLQDSMWPMFDPSIHFAISYPCDEIIDERREPTNLPDPGGLSGSVVWKTNKAGTGSEWTPDMARVIGVAHRYDQEARCLVVTRIECVKGLLLYTLRSDFAFCRWLDRGRPLWDDLDDWVAAETDITNLLNSPATARQGR